MPAAETSIPRRPRPGVENQPVTSSRYRASAVPTAAANVIHFLVNGIVPVNFYATLRITRYIGIAVIAVSLPLLWWRFRRDDRGALTGLAWSMLIVVLFSFINLAVDVVYSRLDPRGRLSEAKG